MIAKCEVVCDSDEAVSDVGGRVFSCGSERLGFVGVHWKDNRRAWSMLLQGVFVGKL